METPSRAELNRKNFLHLFELTMTYGRVVSPRGLVIRELIDPQITIDPQYPFQGFHARKYDVDYFRKEMRWKLGASKMDASIKDHAKMWESVQNPDGSFNSNYGQYWFGQQMGLMKACLELIRDPCSRRACIPMLRDDHLSPETRDTVCTESITFLIRDNRLHCSVHMRSSDQIFGLGTDIPTFSFLMRLAQGILLPHFEHLGLGELKITAASSHIYQRHFEMVKKILEEDPVHYKSEWMPICGPAQAAKLIALRGQKTQYFGLHSDLYEWLHKDQS